MRVYMITFQTGKNKDELAFSSQDYMISGLIKYIQEARTIIGCKMLKYFKEYEKKELKPWEWLFTDLHGYNAFEFEKLLKPFNCKVFCLVVDSGLD